MSTLSAALAGALAVAASTTHFAKSEVKHLAGPFYAVPSLSSGNTLAVINPQNRSIVFAVLDCGKHRIRISKAGALRIGDGDDVGVSDVAPVSKDDGFSHTKEWYWGAAGEALVCGGGVQI